MGNQASSASNILSGNGHKLRLMLRTGDAELEIKEITAKSLQGKDWEPRIMIPIKDVSIELVLGSSSQLILSGRSAGVLTSAVTDGGKVCIPVLSVSKEFYIRQHELSRAEEAHAAVEAPRLESPLEYTWGRHTTNSGWQRVNEYLEIRTSCSLSAAVRTGSRLSRKGFWTRAPVVQEFVEAQADVQMCLEVRWRQPPSFLRELLLRHCREASAAVRRRRASVLLPETEEPQRKEQILWEVRKREGERECRSEIDGELVAAVWPKVAAEAHLERVLVEGSVKLIVVGGVTQVLASRWAMMPA